MIKQPGDLGRGEIRIDNEPGFRGHPLFMACLAKPAADIRRAPVLPDNRAMDRLAGHAVPDDHRLALICDTYPDGRGLGPRDHIAAGLQGQ